jgi:hypothetical protein
MPEKSTSRGSRISDGQEREASSAPLGQEEAVETAGAVAPVGRDETEPRLSPAVAPKPLGKGLLVDVLRPAHGGDNTNFGPSSRFIKFVLVGEEVAGETEPTPDAPALSLIRRGDYLHAEPPIPVPGGCVGYMFGGNFVWAADALFPNDYPIPVHDRLETQEQHELLSSEGA